MQLQDIITDISYTSKDFQSIYPELLDLVKKLTDKWDPSLSNESDPGALLLKLNAIIADKNNYNIDKNVLECFPLSVTQMSNARNLYDLLGYNIGYYKSAIVEVGIALTSLITEAEGAQGSDIITIPKYTEISNSAGDIVYTLLDDVLLLNNNDNLNTLTYVNAIQGNLQDYLVNSQSIITLNDLDSNLRLYFPERQIAENGIIVSVQETNELWAKVDQLSTQELGSKVYSFGITPNTNLCYIQFPQDIGSLIGSGLEIKYTITTGSAGNIKAHTLNKFVNSLTFGDENVDITSKITIVQDNGTTNGKDIETIEEAYKNYKKTIGTFNTIVTKRDYENFIYNQYDEQSNPYVSNLRVTDRTNDINYSNYIQTKTSISQTKKQLVVTDGEMGAITTDNQAVTIKAPKLNAYDIRLYLLQYPESSKDSIDYYNNTFKRSRIDIIDITQDENLINLKSSQHNIQASDGSTLFYVNSFPIKGNLITYDKVTTKDKEQIETNVQEALIKAYNSRELEFGAEIDYDVLLEIIRESDNRIKSVLLDLPSYTPFRVTENNEFQNLYSTSETINDLNNETVARMILAGNVQLFKFDDNFNYTFGQEDAGRVGDSGVYNIKEITTNYNETLSSTPLSIPRNSLIQILIPSLITETEYTSYVSYVFNGLSSGVPSLNKDYKLKTGQSIVLTYKDSATGLTKTETIQAGTYIETNLNLEAEGNLGSGGYIRVKKINEVTLPTNTEYYFITHTLNNENKMLLEIPANGSKVLDDNEYFIYRNSSSTDVIILGSGTRLENNTNVIFTKSLPKLNLIDFNESDFNNLSWEKITANDSINTVELQVISLGEGVKVATSGESINLTNDEYTLAAGTIIYYTEDITLDINTADFIKADDYGVGYASIQSRLLLNATNNIAQELSDGQSIDIVLENDVQKTILGPNKSILFNTAVVGLSGKNIDVSVTTSSGEIEYSLQLYNYTQTTPTDINSLVLNSSNFIEITDAITDTEINFNFTFNSTSDTNRDWYLIPVQIILTGSSTVQSSFTVGTNTALKIFNPTNSIQDSATNLTQGTYILQIPVGAEYEGMKLTLSQALSQGEKIIIGNIVKFNGLNEEEIDTFDLTDITIENRSSTVPVAYSYELLGINDNGTNYEHILEKIKEIDKNNIFDWTYKVPEEDKVTQPLKASAYWDINHIYNDFTLPMIDFNNYNIQVHASSIIKGV